MVRTEKIRMNIVACVCSSCRVFLHVQELCECKSLIILFRQGILFWDPGLSFLLNPQICRISHQQHKGLCIQAIPSSMKALEVGNQGEYAVAPGIGHSYAYDRTESHGYGSLPLRLSAENTSVSLG